MYIEFPPSTLLNIHSSEPAWAFLIGGPRVPYNTNIPSPSWGLPASFSLATVVFFSTTRIQVSGWVFDDGDGGGDCDGVGDGVGDGDCDGVCDGDGDGY